MTSAALFTCSAAFSDFRGEENAGRKAHTNGKNKYVRMTNVILIKSKAQKCYRAHTSYRIYRRDRGDRI